VLAFTGAPGAFPVLEKDVQLQKYIKWSDQINQKADSLIDSYRKNPEEKLLALHLRNGIDFVRYLIQRFLKN
jgi:peptide-O-fucosyltransferase